MKQKLKEALKASTDMYSGWFSDYIETYDEEPYEIIEQAAQDLLFIVDFEGSDDEVLLNAYTILEKYTESE